MMVRNRKRRNEGGFTLIEALVTLVIISVSLLALGAFTLTVLSTDNTARHRTVATHLAEQELERWFQTDVAPAPGTNGWPKTINNTKYSLKDSGGSTGIWTATLTGTGYNGELRAVTVYWTDKREHSVTVTHIKKVQ